MKANSCPPTQFKAVSFIIFSPTKPWRQTHVPEALPFPQKKKAGNPAALRLK
jgi:hypothetical protein